MGVCGVLRIPDKSAACGCGCWEWVILGIARAWRGGGRVSGVGESERGEARVGDWPRRECQGGGNLENRGGWSWMGEVWV